MEEKKNTIYKAGIIILVVLLVLCNVTHVLRYNNRLQDTYNEVYTDGDIQVGIDVTWNKVEIFKSIFSFLELIFEPIDSNDMVTIEKTNNTLYVNHSSPENWSKLVGYGYAEHDAAGYVSNGTMYNDIKYFFNNWTIGINKPVYQQMFCGRQWKIEIENGTWYVNRFTEGKFSYTELVIAMGVLLE